MENAENATCLRRALPPLPSCAINRAVFYTFDRGGAYEIGHVNNVATLNAVDYRTVFRVLAEHIEGAYCLEVNVGPVTGSYSGQFDGKEIWVDLDNKEEDLPRIYQYERQASQLGLALLEETGEFHLARWLTDRFGADWKFLAHFYRTGEKVRFESEEGADEPLLTALPIPSFIPQRWPPRGSF